MKTTSLCKKIIISGKADAANLKDLDRVAEVVLNARGKIVVVVSNAGFTEQVALRDITEEHYNRR